ncbi:UNVERIFIED_CONTAM: hypothetical protein GTU68_061527 [Idotea baltica]|nr:hypothetical protein [Idotea baltica]
MKSYLAILVEPHQTLLMTKYLLVAHDMPKRWKYFMIKTKYRMSNYWKYFLPLKIRQLKISKVLIEALNIALRFFISLLRRKKQQRIIFNY